MFFFLLLLERRGFSSEKWYSIELGNQKIGYDHVQVVTVQTNSQEVTITMVLSRTSIRRGWNMELGREVIAKESNGELLSFEVRDPASKRTMMGGEKVDHEFKVFTNSHSNGLPHSIPTEGPIIGPAGFELFLKKQKSSPGFRQVFHAFDEDFKRIETVSLTTVGSEDSDKKINVFKVRKESDAEPASTLWINSSGEMIKTQSDILGGLITKMTNKSDAVALADSSKDLMLTALIPLKNAIPEELMKGSITYVMKYHGGDPKTIIPEDERQKFSKDKNGDCLLTVKAGRGFPIISSKYGLKSTRDLAGLASVIVGNEKDPMNQIRLLQSWVYQNMQNASSPNPAADVDEILRTMEGDCKEHAILFSRLADSIRLPCRMIVGIVYDPVHIGFVPHMWNEVSISKTWIPIDSTRAEAVSGPDHIKVTDAGQADINIQKSFSRVLEACSALKLQLK